MYRRPLGLLLFPEAPFTRAALDGGKLLPDIFSFQAQFFLASEFVTRSNVEAERWICLFPRSHQGGRFFLIILTVLTRSQQSIESFTEEANGLTFPPAFEDIV